MNAPDPQTPADTLPDAAELARLCEWMDLKGLPGGTIEDLRPLVLSDGAGRGLQCHHELPYAMAMGALHTMSASLATLYGGKVRVNVIVPGAFLTDISKAWSEEMHQRVRKSVPMGRAGEPSEIVGAALYLASDAASYTTGAVIKVDGGMAFSRG
jgi:NAD(P)-dependent dehydrogenase (short-subunit alcohol dehydrogenase family)